LHAGSVTQDTLVTLTAHFGAVTHSVSFTVTPGAPPPPPPPPPPAAALASLTFTPASVQGGTSSTGVVTLTAPAPSGGLTVSLNSPSARVSVPASVTVLAGQISRSFTATTSAVTATTPVDLTASAGTKSVTGRLTLTAPTPPNADTVRVTRAQYDAAKRQLRVEATSTSTTATLTAFAEPSGARIGVLQNNGGGQYRGQFDGVDNPGTVRVTS